MPDSTVSTDIVSIGSKDALTEIVREGAQQMLARAVENEVAEYLRRHADQRAQQRQSLLWQGRTRALLEDLKAQRRGHRGPKRKALDDLIRYLQTNEEQMRYDVFRAHEYDIGSGAVEGACKHVVAKRLKQSGMIWTRPGSSAVLALRITWLNTEWNPFWNRKPMAA